MIEAHTLDAWTRGADRSSVAFQNLRIIGGFAAPLFLWLAGVSVVLSAESRAREAGSRRPAMAAAIRRGAEILILGLLFRLQAFVLTPGSSPVSLLRVDILNVMGPAIAAAGLIWGIAANAKRAALASAAGAALLSMLTPVVRSSAWVDNLPTWLQWYLRPAGEHTTFTLLPWAGFVLAGAAAGSVLWTAGDRRAEARLVGFLAVGSALLFGLGFYAASLPSIYRASSFWTSSPTYFAIRVSIVTLLLAAMFALSTLAAWLPGPFAILERFGRHSLLVYWIHVELVYGYATWPIHGRLPLLGAAVAYVLFCGLMYSVAVASDRAGRFGRARRAREQPVTA
jgi:uncharacterized membrane protein